MKFSTVAPLFILIIFAGIGLNEWMARSKNAVVRIGCSNWMIWLLLLVLLAAVVLMLTGHLDPREIAEIFTR